MNEDQDLSTPVCGRSPMPDKLGCGCKRNVQARINMLVLVQAAQARICNNQEHGCIELLLREDKQELNVWEQKKTAEDAKRIRGIVHENGKNQVTNNVQDEMGILMHHDEQALLGLWQGWHWDDTKGEWLDPELCGKARREEVKYILRHRMYTRVPRVMCLREAEKAPIKTGWAETDKGQPGKPNVRVRWVAKAYKTYARPELYASTPALDALKVVLSEVASGKRGGKVVALVNVPRAFFYAPRRRRVFVELPPENLQGR